MKKIRSKQSSLIWVYPPNNWISNFNQTFIYGSTNPKSKLFYQVDNSKEKKIKIFKNGNFAQVIKLPAKKNNIQLIQSLNNKVQTVSRSIDVDLVKKTNQKIKVTPFKIPDFSSLCLVIDPGHGGKEHGTHSPIGIPEKYFNLQVSKMLLEAIHAVSQPIHLTRTSDKFISLDDRVAFAQKKRCNLFISIHHNALPDNEDPLKHRGVGIYFTHDELKPLAKLFLNNICHESNLKKYGVFKRDFRVIKQNTYAGILIECGFLTHPIESEIITNKVIQQKIVNGIFKTVISLH